MTYSYILKKYLAALLGFSLLLPASAEEIEPLYSFETPDSMQIWRSVNDGVMGGRSRGGFKHLESKTLLFTGNLSLDNGGGFASIRTKPSAMNLAGATGIIVKARGDGRTYRVQLRTDDSMATSYRVDFPTTKGAFIEVLIPFSDFKLQVFGNFVPDSKPIDPAAINSLGFSVADKKAGPFEFELESVKTFRGEITPSVKTNYDEVKVPVEAARFIDNSLAIVSYHPPLRAKLAKMAEIEETARMLDASPPGRTRIVFDHSGTPRAMTDFVYVQQGSTIEVYDAEGNAQRPIAIPSEVRDFISFTVLPDGRIALFDNRYDAIYFLDRDGQLLKTVAISDKRDRRLQNMRGIVVENKLIVSENGYNKLLSVDLSTYELSVFLSLSQLKGWLGAITYSDGLYYICQSTDIYSYNPELDEVLKVATAPRGNITGISVENNQLFVSSNGRGKKPAQDGALYQIDLKSGNIAELKNALTSPKGLMLLKPKEDMIVIEEIKPPSSGSVGTIFDVLSSSGKAAETIHSRGKPNSSQHMEPGKEMYGAWVNTNEYTRGMTKLAIYEKNFTTFVHAFGSCVPNDCDWGATEFHALGDSIEATILPYGFATWDMSSQKSHVTFKLEGENLTVTRFGINKGGDFRTNSRYEYTFRKALGDEAILPGIPAPPH